MTSEDFAIAIKLGATPLHIFRSVRDGHGEGAIKMLPASANPQSDDSFARSFLAQMDLKNRILSAGLELENGVACWPRRTVLFHIRLLYRTLG